MKPINRRGGLSIEDRIAYGHEVRSQRLRRHMTIRELSIQSGISEKSLSAVERGYRSVGYVVRNQIAKVLWPDRELEIIPGSKQPRIKQSDIVQKAGAMIVAELEHGTSISKLARRLRVSDSVVIRWVREQGFTVQGSGNGARWIRSNKL